MVVSDPELIASSPLRRALATSGVLAVVAVVLYILGVPAGVETTFQLARGDELFLIPNFSVPSKATGVVISLALIALAAYAAWRTSRREKVGWWLPVTFGVLFVFGFLVYAGAGNTGVIPITTLLAGGLAPLIAAVLIKNFPDQYWPLAVYIMSLAVVSLLCVYYPVSYTHLRAHETVLDLVCRLLLEKKKTNIIKYV